MSEAWPVPGAGAHGGPASSAPPPGWYPDPWGQAPHRFWDGAGWTPYAAVGGRSERPRLAEGVPVYGWLIWTLALLPLVTGAVLWLFGVDTSSMADYFRAADDAARTGTATYVAPPNPFTMFGPGYAAMMALSPLLLGVRVVLAYLDSRALGRIGVARPFHWAWAFLGEIVYVIGRSVVVRKVAAPRGYAPMWTVIAAQVVGMVSAWVWIAVFFVSMTRQLPS